MKLTTTVPRGHIVIVSDPTTDIEVLRFVAVTRCVLHFDGYRVIVKHPCESVYSA